MRVPKEATKKAKAWWNCIRELAAACCESHDYEALDGTMVNSSKTDCASMCMISGSLQIIMPASADV